MLRFAKKLWPLNRSLTGKGVDDTFKLIKKKIPIRILNFKSGTKVFDWRIPKVWNLKDAWIKDQKNQKIIDFKHNNLHVVGYSKKVSKDITLDDLKKKLHFLRKQPNAIPYVTSYYKKDWGFCIQYKKFKVLRDKKYKVLIDSTFKNGDLKIAELYIKGKSTKEVLITTYTCHPSMANNEISGIVVLTQLSLWLKKRSNKYSYRILFLPETIGSIAYLSRNYKKLKKNVIAGYVLTCIGDNKNYSLLESKNKNTLSNIVAKEVLKKKNKAKIFDWSHRGSDERQFCSPGIDLPIASLMRTKYNEYNEYHTSLDKIGKVVTKKGLEGGLEFVKDVIKLLEKQIFPISTTYCEPFLSKKNIYPTLSIKGSVSKQLSDNLNYLSYCDGRTSVLEISKKLKLSKNDAAKILKFLVKHNLVKLNETQN